MEADHLARTITGALSEELAVTEGLKQSSPLGLLSGAPSSAATPMPSPLRSYQASGSMRHGRYGAHSTQLAHYARAMKLLRHGPFFADDALALAIRALMEPVLGEQSWLSDRRMSSRWATIDPASPATKGTRSAPPRARQYSPRVPQV